jgi:hypothetical protein
MGALLSLLAAIAFAIIYGAFSRTIPGLTARSTGRPGRSILKSASPPTRGSNLFLLDAP